MEERSKRQSEKALEKNRKQEEARKAESEKEAFALLKYVRISARKVRLVIDQVRGKKVSEAAQILSLLPNRSAKTIHKVLKSAAANAVNNKGLTLEKLYIKQIYANEGATLKRFQARAKGSAGAILKRSSHIYVTVAEGE